MFVCCLPVPLHLSIGVEGFAAFRASKLIGLCACNGFIHGRGYAGFGRGFDFFAALRSVFAHGGSPVASGFGVFLKLCGCKATVTVAAAHFMSFFFIKLIDKIKNTTVTKATQTIAKSHIEVAFKPRKDPMFPDIKPRVMSTTWVKGKTPNATPCKAEEAGPEITVIGKNVPLSKNMGVINRNVGKLKKSMLDAKAVKHIASEAKSSPPKNATIGTRTAQGLEIKPKTATTIKTIVPLMAARVAPQRSSPAITSSTLTGVAMIASKVFWKYMRTNDA